MADPKHLVRTRSLPPAEAMHISQPFNPKSDVAVQTLSDRVGMKRAHVSLARVPPGRESYVPHAHAMEEEWLFILEGTGRALIGDQTVEVGPGDYMGFPTDGTVHHLANTGTVDLVYLQGGERLAAQLVRFPTVGKVGMFTATGGATFYPESAAETLPDSAWEKKDK
jgi:uncharacterized cupin superfamily protein